MQIQLIRILIQFEQDRVEKRLDLFGLFVDVVQAFHQFQIVNKIENIAAHGRFIQQPSTVQNERD